MLDLQTRYAVKGAAANKDAPRSPAPDLDGVFYELRGRQPRRDAAEPVEIFAAYWPVALIHESSAYFFCSLTCAAAFAQNPDRYAGENANTRR
jgi:hypothetical protein